MYTSRCVVNACALSAAAAAAAAAAARAETKVRGHLGLAGVRTLRVSKLTKYDSVADADHAP